jgi:hypothetical protein
MVVLLEVYLLLLACASAQMDLFNRYGNDSRYTVAAGKYPELAIREMVRPY